MTVIIVDDLERSGWATRTRSESDRRRHALYVTPAGEEKLDELFKILEQTEDAALHTLSPAELHLLHELLDRLYAACTPET